MNRKRDLSNIGNIYSGILDKVSVIVEKREKTTAKKGIASGSFQVASDKKPTDAKAKPEPFVNKNSGPAKADGVKTDIIDPGKDGKKNKKEDFYQAAKFSQVKVEKTESEDINNCMSKSTFDKLYEDVMSGEDISTDVDQTTDHTGTGEHDAEIGQEDDIVEKLHSAIELLNAVVEKLAGAEGEAENVDNEIGAEEDSDNEVENDNEDELAGEATDIKELKDGVKTMQNKNNKVGDETASLVDGKEGDGKIKDGATGKLEKGPAAKSTPVTGKANVVSGKASNTGKYLFQK